MNISEYSVRRPIVAIIVISAISLLGAFAVDRLPLLFLPEFSQPFLFINIPYKSTSPREIERLITMPVEGIMGGISHLEKVSSTSTGTGSNVRLEFEMGTDMDLASMEVRDRIDQIRGELPEDVGTIRIRRWQTTDQPILNFSLAWDGPQSELNNIAEDVIAPRILRIEGVADVDIQGIQRRQITVDLDSQLMKSYGVSVNDINQSLRANNLNLSGGYILDGGRRYIVRSIGEFADISEISLLPIKGSKVKLGDLGKVSYKYPDRDYYHRLNHLDAVSVRVFKSSTANIVDVSRRVRKMIEEIKSEPGMERLTIHIFFDQADEIVKSLNNLRNAGIVGGILAVIMLFLFLWKVRSTLIIAMAIPISILCTFTLMFLLRRLFGIDVTLNIISLSGLMLAVGMLVDNGIVVLENIFRHREEGEAPMEAAIKGASEVETAVLASTLTTIIVFVPLLFMSRTTFGRFMGDFGLSIVVALVASLFVALTLIPLISSRIFTGTEKGKHRVIRWLINLYTGVMNWTLRHRLATVLIMLAILGGSVYLFTKIEREFVPPAPSRSMDITVEVPRSFSINDVKGVFDRVEELLMKNKDELEIKMLSTNFRAGRSRIAIFFKDLEESRYSTTQLQNKVRELLPEIPGVAFKVGRGWGMGGGELGISVDLKGPDSEVLAIYADDVKGRLKGIKGVKDVDSSLESGEEEVQVTVDRVKARRYGLSSSQVAQSISSNLSASATSKFKARDEEIPINVQLREEDRANLEQLKQVRFEGAANLVSLGTLADFSVEKGPLSIQREDGYEIVTVFANTDRSGMVALQGEIERNMRDLKMPSGYSWQVGQSFRRFMESQQNSRFAIFLAVVFIYLVMASLFESFVHPITILFSVPFAITGVSIVFYFTRTTLNSNSWLGMMVLFGIVVNNGIILIDHINRLRRSGMDRKEAIIKGGQDRLRPILMTVSTTLLGLMPMVAPILFPSIFGPIEGRAGLYGPIALALVGGLTTSTFLTLIIIPTIYSLADDFGEFVKKIVRSI
ncbi:MAG: efflux RND transporter permease subunit [bacterium]